MNLLAASRRLVATGPVCDACLGRPFADRSFGLSNAERGRALRVTLALDDDDPYESPDSCWVCEGHAAMADQWAEQIVDAVSAYDFETFQIGTRVPPLIEENDRLFREDAGLDPDAGESFKSDFNREVGKRVADRLDISVDFKRPDVLAVIELDSETIDLQVNSAFVYGRYRKLERGIPQTEWPCRECNGSGVVTVDDETQPCEHCDGEGYLYATSVEEEIAPAVMAAMDGADATFHGAGREDVDARMLGTGRPFVLEVDDPHVRTPDVEALEAQINEEADGVAVDGLRLATHEMVERVKRLDASKTYRAIVAFDDPVTETALANALATLDGATIEQYTPERVDHRRASRTRTRTIYAADGELESPTQATLQFHTEGGLYVKELVSGDNDRTDPSLAGLLGTGATVTALDVLAVEGEDEAFEQPAFFRTHNS
ncbi:MAG: tRNA pseudouridine(54/55) synthase Pus10 [Salinarchaeum sp.]